MDNFSGTASLVLSLRLLELVGFCLGNGDWRRRPSLHLWNRRPRGVVCLCGVSSFVVKNFGVISISSLVVSSAVSGVGSGVVRGVVRHL